MLRSTTGFILVLIAWGTLFNSALAQQLPPKTKAETLWANFSKLNRRSAPQTAHPHPASIDWEASLSQLRDQEPVDHQLVDHESDLAAPEDDDWQADFGHQLPPAPEPNPLFDEIAPNDDWLPPHPGPGETGLYESVPWTLQVLPDGLMYKAFLAGVKEPRFSTAYLYQRGRGWVWDSTLGGKVGVLRWGTPGAVNPQGWQLDMEGAAMARLDVQHKDDLDAVDFRFGTPFTYREGPWAFKFGYNHISSHLGDEFMLRNPDYERLNYVRDSLLIGIAYDVTLDIRIYAEAAWAFKADGGAKPWEFQFGAEYSPMFPTGLQGSPYAAVHGHLREEFNYGGSVNVMAGWQWRSGRTNRLWRFGMQYFNGKSPQYSFFDYNERLIGLGLWYDF